MLPVYHNEMLKLVNLGFIEEVDPNLVTGSPSYMPHRPVIRVDKATSKVRPVFDGSAKTKSANRGRRASTTVWKLV